MRKKKSLWSGVSVLIVVVLAIILLCNLYTCFDHVCYMLADDFIILISGKIYQKFCEKV